MKNSLKIDETSILGIKLNEKGKFTVHVNLCKLYVIFVVTFKYAQIRRQKENGYDFHIKTE